MDEAWDDLPEPDLVLAVSPPVPRRTLAASSQRPTDVPDPVPSPAPSPAPPTMSSVAAPPPSPLPPPVPAASAAVDAVPPIVEAADEARPGSWPDRRWWASTGTSTVVHVVVLTILALIVARPDVVPRPRPIEFSRPSEDLEPMPFLEPDEQLAVEVLEPVAEPEVADVVEQAVLVESDAADATAAAFEADADPLGGVVELDQAGIAMQVGGGAGGGQMPGGFGGEIGRRLARAGAKTGDVQVSLSWENFNDIDLHVITPAGERIFFAHRRSACRGTLDVDMNAQGPTSREPVENVFWPKQAAPNGEYQVFVHHFAKWDRSADETAFDVHVLVNGLRRRFSGYVKSGDPPVAVTRFVKRAAAAEPGEFVE